MTLLLEKNIPKTENKKKTPLGRIFLLICLSIFLFINGSHWVKDLSKVGFWWALLKPKIEKIAGGGKFECKKIEWCGTAGICGQFCENTDNSLLIENFSIHPLKGSVHIKEWALTHLPKSKRKGFPQIPLPINKIILEKGDLSLLNNYLPNLTYLELNRQSSFSSEWFIQANLQKNIFISGLVGKKSNIQIKFNQFSIKKHTLLNGLMEANTDDFAKKPIKIKLKNIQLEKLIYKKIQLPIVFLQGDFKINENFNKILSASNISLKAGKIHIHSNNFSDELELEPLPLSFLNTYLSLNSNFKDYKLKGSAKGLLKINYNQLQKTKSFLNFNSLFISNKNISSLGAFNGEIELFGTKINKYKIQTNTPINLISLEKYLNQIEKNKKIKLQKGFAQGNFIYANNALSGNLQIFNLKGLYSEIPLYVDNSNFKINNNILNGTLIGYVNDKRNLFNIKTDLNKNIKNTKYLALNGLIEINAKQFIFPENLNSQFNLIESKINNLIINIQITNNKISSLKGFADINKIILQNKKNIKFTQGKLELKPNSHLFINNLKAMITPSDSALINGNIKFTDYTFQKIINNHINIQADGLAENIFPLIPELNKINSPQGNLSLKAEINNNKLTQFQILVSELNGQFQNYNFTKGKGLIELTEKQKLNFQDFHFNYGHNSEINLNGFIIVENNTKKNIQLNDLLSSFNGSLDGIIYLKDLISESLKNKYQISFTENTHFPIKLIIKPSDNHNISFDFDSHFDSIGSISSNLLTLSDDLPGYIIADGIFNLKDQSFDLKRLETSITGLNLIGKAEGNFNNFTVKAYTDPLINLGKLFKEVKGLPIQGSFSGWIEGKEINIFDKTSIWENLKLSLKTETGENLAIGPLEFTSLETYFESKNNKGLASIIAEKGQFKNLILSEINSSLKLENNKLIMPGLSLSSAGGTITIKGDLDLNTNNGSFSGNALKVNVGQLARGLANLKGFGGKGDLTFAIDGHLLSLIKSEKPVSASGEFKLRDGNASQVITLQKKLNLANLVFGGPLALNMNGLLEFLAPESNGYYESLSGFWRLENNKIIFPQIAYRGTNKLHLNMAGFLDRNNGQLKMNVIGSIPRTPVRIDSNGRPSEFLNLISQINLNNVLGRFPVLDKIFDAKPRTFGFLMQGNINNQKELNASASNSFVFSGSKSSKNLKMPSLPK